MKLKYFSQSFLIIVLLTGAGKAHGQVSQDSAMVLSVKDIQKQLGLTGSTTTAFLTIYRQLFYSTASLNQNSSLSPADRNKGLILILQQYYSLVQGILTPVQWGQYQQFEAATRQGFLQQAKARGIKVQELNINE